MGIEDKVQDEQVPEVQDKGYGQKIMEYAKWPLIAGGVLWFSLFGAPQKDMKNTVIQKSGQNRVTENNYAQEALDGIVNGLQSAGVSNVNAGGLDYDSMAQKMAEMLENPDKADDVIKQFSKYADDESNNSAYFFNQLGLAYSKEGMLDKAIEAYEQSTQIGDKPIAFYNLGTVYIKKAKVTGEHDIIGNAVEPWKNYLKVGDDKEKLQEVREYMPTIKKYK